MSLLAPAFQALRTATPIGMSGAVRSLKGLTLQVDELSAPVGSLVRVRTRVGEAPAEVVGFEGARTIVMLLGASAGVCAGDRVDLIQTAPTVRVGRGLLGRVIDGLGRPIDGGPPPRELVARPITPEPLGAMSRAPITQPIETGVRAIDLMTTLGRGQRMGVFAGPGVGKSTVLGMIARGTSADASVIALIGERGREVREFIDHALGPQGLARSVVVVATSDESPVMRVRAAQVACAAAEALRDDGADVLLMMDSVTRFAHAQRQIGLAVGEPPATRGYTPSVFAMLPVLLERAGAVREDAASGRRAGSITGLYTVLVEGDDMTEPIADAARGILDGHVILSRRLAQRGHYPAIDVLDSVSRVAGQVCTPEHASARSRIIRWLAAYEEAYDLIQIGAYAPGANPATDVAILMKSKLDALLQQATSERESLGAARDRMIRLVNEAPTVGAAPQGPGNRGGSRGAGNPGNAPAQRSGGAR